MTNKPQFVGERVQTLLLDCAKLTGKGPSSFEGARCYASTSAVSDGTVHPDQLEQVTYNNRPSRANQIAQAGDVIVARMQATSKVLEVNETNEGFIYSTGFAVLSPHPSIISQRCLFHLLLSPSFKRSKDKLCTGATQKAITNAGFKKLKISFPRRDYQDQAVSKLDHVLGQIKNSEQRLATLDALVKSRFVEMFGDPATNSHNLPTERLSALGSLERGRSKHRPRNAPELRGGPDGPYPLVQTGDITNAGLYLSTYEDTYTELGLHQSKIWPKGTLCITIAANIAQTSILAIDACFPDSVVGFTPGPAIQNVFLHYWFDFFQGILEEQAPQAAQKNINLRILSELSVITPSMEMQQEFADFVAQVDKSRFIAQQQIEKLQMLYDKLAQDYFG